LSTGRHGEQGSAKGITAKVLRRLIDPNTASSRSPLRSKRNFVISANSGFYVVLVRSTESTDPDPGWKAMPEFSSHIIDSTYIT
jgi:hypothetical protein